MKPLRILAFVVGAAFILLLIVGFDNVLALARSRVALFLVLFPLIAIFLWSVWRALPQRRGHDDVIDITPDKHDDPRS